MRQKDSETKRQWDKKAVRQKTDGQTERGTQTERWRERVTAIRSNSNSIQFQFKIDLLIIPRTIFVLGKQKNLWKAGLRKARTRAGSSYQFFQLSSTLQKSHTVGKQIQNKKWNPYCHQLWKGKKPKELASQHSSLVRHEIIYLQILAII